MKAISSLKRLGLHQTVQSTIYPSLAVYCCNRRQCGNAVCFWIANDRDQPQHRRWRRR